MEAGTAEGQRAIIRSFAEARSRRRGQSIFKLTSKDLSLEVWYGSNSVGLSSSSEEVPCLLQSVPEAYSA